MEKTGVPGMSVAAVSGGKVIYVKSYGVRPVGGAELTTTRLRSERRRPLSAYVGVYRNDSLRTPKGCSPMRHFSAKVFTFQPTGENAAIFPR